MSAQLLSCTAILALAAVVPVVYLSRATRIEGRRDES